ncbi:hypothetical protein OJ997_27640 [Solirubrobacter phytolaccae]|uniref:Uncharacterized protein n=1 Tax=Solirubrobacter phytolaccae TaxID=1404360 RepID=A0A9X3SAW3_9ACTN|nr:hypothetical protein [Solirubrobacter phytolaccae]MDA0184113.1 hypothetical protein [Solirubrobacter phytolaccae]
MKHFLLTFNLVEGRVTELKTFADSAAAGRAYVHAERKNAGDPDREIVLVGADSLATLKMTHAHYFGDEAGESTSPYLAGV